jgi:hypothetical protein
VAFKRILAAAASVALVTAPTMAVAQRSAPTQAVQAIAPADETVDEGSELRGGFVIPLVALIAIILGLCAAGVFCGDNDKDLPTSP